MLSVSIHFKNQETFSYLPTSLVFSSLKLILFYNNGVLLEHKIEDIDSVAVSEILLRDKI